MAVPALLSPGAQAAFPGANGKIAFTSTRDHLLGEIYVMNADGTGQPQRLTNNAAFDSEPAWSPDGRKIAFTSTRDDGRGEIYVMNGDGTGPVERLTHSPTSSPFHMRMDESPAWSPDGQRIAFVSDREGICSGYRTIYVMNASGTEQRPLTGRPFPNSRVCPQDVDPDWSPDGQQIAFLSNRFRDDGNIAYANLYVMNPDGTEPPQRITPPVYGRNERHPAWSPDGQQIAFMRSDGNPEIHVMNANGTGTPGNLTNNPWTDAEPTWQPLQLDTDGDALPDSWERDGLDVDGDGTIDLDLPAMGADPMHKDIFVEIDAMTNHRLQQAAIDEVVSAFRLAPVSNPDGVDGIALHVDNGPASIMNPRTGERWGTHSRGTTTIPHENVLGIGLGDFLYSWSEFDGIKDFHFEEARRPVFHYVVSGHQYGHPFNTSGGLSRGIGASDFIVTLGPACAPPGDCSGTVKQQAGTFMHELGHNLGLWHGGQDLANRKPNQLSIMNYSFGMTGLLVHVGGIMSTVFDYSRFGASAALTQLVEINLSETAGFGSGVTDPLGSTYVSVSHCPDGTWRPLLVGAPVDWDCSGTIEAAPVSVDINEDPNLVLKPFEEWSRLVFSGGAIGDAGASVELPAETEMIEPQLEELLETARVLRPDLYAPADAIPPATAATATPGANAAGWNNTDVTVMLGALDNDGGSGVMQITYSATGAQTIAPTTVVGSQVTVKISAEGETTLTFFATDNAGNREPAQAVGIRVDRSAPTLSCSVSPNRLWPPNHTLVTVRANVAVTDVLSGPAGFSLISVTSNEPDNGLGDGDTVNDIQGFAIGAPDTSGQLRAERSGTGSGRTYTLTYQGLDAAGNAARCAPTVGVPKSKG